MTRVLDKQPMTTMEEPLILGRFNSFRLGPCCHRLLERSERRQGRGRKERQQKENISATTALISKQEHSSVGLRNPNQNKPEIQNAITVYPQQLKQHTDELVPPLKYPPKNIMALMEQIRRGRTGRQNEGVDNLHLNRYPYNTDMRGHMNHWPIDASHSRPAQAHFNVSMTGAGYVRVCSKFGTMRGGENMGFNCKRKYFGDRHQSGQANADENHWDYLKDGTGRRGNYIHGKRFMCGGEKQQANGRRILVDLNMDRGFLGMSCKFGDEYCMDCAEDRNGRRNYNVQERGSFGGSIKDRVFRSASNKEGHSERVIEEGARAKKGHDDSNKKGAGSRGNNGKKRGMLSAPPKSGSHQRRPNKQSGK